MKTESKKFSYWDLLFVAVVTAIVAAISIPMLLASRRTTGETAAISTLRAIQAAQSVHASRFGGATFGTFDQLRDGGLLDQSLTGAGVVKNNYVIDQSVSADASGYCAKASPLSPSGGARYFGINQKGVLYQSASKTGIDCTAGVLTTDGAASAVY